MDHNTSAREIVYCHQCENEWYRHEHGIICPECGGEFTEIVEAGHDPRQDEQHLPPDHDAPDPDEDDIDNLRFEQTGPDTYRLRGRYTTTIDRQQGQQLQQQAQQAQPAGGLMGLVGNLLSNMVQGQQQQQQQGPHIPGRPASAPSSPPPQGEQIRGGNGTFIRSGQGPGFSYTIATSSNANFGGGPDLFPRNANAPQPMQHQPAHLDDMIRQMMMNIGVGPGMGGGMRAGGMGMPPHPFHNHDHFGPGSPPIIIAGPGFGGPGGGGMGIPASFAQLLNLFGPPGGAMGDAVYSQEALDRIITQLMEQHQAGNAPGPASEAAIRALPTRPISAKDQADSGKAECSICMDEVPLGESVTELPCHHWFHFDCIKAWLGEHDTCPHCRQGITPADPQAQGQQPRSPDQPPLHDMHSPEYTRPAVPGGYPFPRQDSFGREGERRRNSDGSRSVLGRMRDAFSGAGSRRDDRGSSGGGGGGPGS